MELNRTVILSNALAITHQLHFRGTDYANQRHLTKQETPIESAGKQVWYSALIAGLSFKIDFLCYRKKKGNSEDLYRDLKGIFSIFLPVMWDNLFMNIFSSLLRFVYSGQL